MNPFDEEDVRLLGTPLTRQVLGCAMAVHQELGPGLLENAFRTALVRELQLAGLHALPEVALGMSYKGVEIDCGYRADILVEQKLRLELKSVERVLPIHQAQLLTYLRVAKLRVGLIINFNAIHLRQGLKRLVV